MKKIAIIFSLTLIALSLSAQLDRSKRPEADKPPVIKIGKATKFTLNNGLKVIVVENHKTPMVSYSLSLEINPILEGENCGYVGLMGDMIGAGTTTRTKEKLDQEVDFMGATLNPTANGIFARSLKKHSENLLVLMNDVLMNPAFPQEELDKLKKQAITDKKTEMDEAKQIAENVANTLRYGAHPYGEVSTEKTLSNISLDLFKNYHQKYFKPNNGYLVIVGDITPSEAKKQAKKYFGQWQSGVVEQTTYEAPKPYATPVVAIANKDGANQSSIRVTYSVDLTPGSPDAIKARVMNMILGGGSFSARLFKNLREEHAYTYGAYSALDADKWVGNFEAFTQVRTSVTDSAIFQILQEMKTLRTDLVTNDELQLIKNSLAGSFGRSLEDPATIARFALNIERYKLPVDYYETYLQKVEAITPEDVRAMAQKYLLLDNAVIIAVGDVSKIANKMKQFSPTGDVTLYDAMGKKMEEVSADKNTTVQEVLTKFYDAVGGIEKLKAVKELEIKSQMSVNGMILDFNVMHKDGDKLKITTTRAGKVMSEECLNGNKAVMKTPNGNLAIEGKALQQMKEQAIIFPEINYLSAGYTSKILGVENFEDEAHFKVSVTSPDGSETIILFNKETGLKTRQIDTTPQGKSITTIRSYMEFDGIQMPKYITIKMGEQAVEMNINQVKINGGIKDSEFMWE